MAENAICVCHGSRYCSDGESEPARPPDRPTCPPCFDQNGACPWPIENCPDREPARPPDQQPADLNRGRMDGLCCTEIYWCPTVGEIECGVHGGFDVCCEHPELHAAPESAISALSRRVKELEAIEKIVKWLENEVDCRIEHGAESGGHLEYVRDKLREALAS
jgi:hypothetical protein